MLAEQLSRKITVLSGREPEVRRLHFFNGRSAQLFSLDPLLGQVCDSDPMRFRRAIAGPLFRCNDIRSEFTCLEPPAEVNGLTVRQLRFKGVKPVASGTEVLRYQSGAGFVPVLLEPAGGSMIAGRRERDAWEYSAMGTLSLVRLRTEVETALKLGPRRTDLLLGFGLYDKLHFNGQPVGFAIYGMDRPTDQRLVNAIQRSIMAIQLDLRERFGAQARKAGELLRQMHQMGLAHRYPHLGNIGIGGNGARIVDLDTAVNISSLPPGARAAFLYLDLSLIIGYFNLMVAWGGGNKLVGFSAVPLLPDLLNGYFGDDSGHEFLRRLNGISDFYDTEKVIAAAGFPFKLEGHTHGDLNAMHRNSFFLRPRFDAYRGAPVDLQDHCRANPAFASFFRAVEQVAESIELAPAN
ncbi:MAG TPA: hypothetical protein VMD02_06640 [Candidatus Omnitrophota bacterium]|nr:hypothetical protein [Candidatus Omnitrophota bacterium]